MSAIVVLCRNPQVATAIEARQTLHRPARRFVILGLLALILPIPAQTQDSYDKRQRFDVEQCANLCQIQLDRRLFPCLSYREDKERAAPDDCRKAAYAEYEGCMKYCSADAG